MNMTESEMRLQCLRMAHEYYAERNAEDLTKIAEIFWSFVSRNSFQELQRGRRQEFVGISPKNEKAWDV